MDADGEPQWEVIQISQLEHPNILSAIAGLPPPIPGAVELASVRQNLTSDAHWGTWVAEEDYNPEWDVDLWDGRWYGLPEGEVADGVLDELVDEEGETLPRRDFLGLAAGVTEEAIREGLRRFFPRRYWRPGPVGDARILGRYPRQPAYAVFHEGMFAAAEKADVLVDNLFQKVEIGVDVARFGDDMTVVHVQRGGICLEHEARAQSDTTATARWVEQVAYKWARVYAPDPDRFDAAELVIARVDDTGVGGGVTDQIRGIPVVPVVAQRRAIRDERYPDARSEMMFVLADRMGDGKVSTAKLPDTVRNEIRRQAEKVMWKQDTKGRRRVFPKAVVKDALGRSPDDLDAMALAHYPLGAGSGKGAAVEPRKPEPIHRREMGKGTSRLFGR